MTLSRVGVLGGGRMGAGIAHAFLMAGASVVVVDINPDPALERITRDVEKSIERGATGAAADYLSRLSCVTSASAFEGCELVVEAIPENFDMKVSAFKDIAEAAPHAVIASNTSSLSISDLAVTTPHPENVIGLHFFNPVPASKLVEIVVAETTAPALVDKARGWVSDLGKTPIVVKDSPGFASSRLGVVIALEAIRMVEEGVASAEDIDNAMVLGYKFPVGPLALTDIVGLDVRLGISEYLASTLGERFEPPALMREMVARGELGRKSGKGFYEYSD
ncbi:putative 3-hydroxybutyryl-CoA dehydrogenase [Corynebacterium kalinowskii]|uniref:3-hydroxybutyryl-CoA dehydrogenase n=1 Tax=Corynebacterium kalinowskii TaxID=2675216 RepID=A0A6B8VDC3_9CORY|nr:3-hydroxyacyl-CoA dehydrogenase family protein [Corynebacterium kalinowskii]QGU03222.1 putative 3-hydroxybutyryl-CoA dehydrogenase [Corynebacterium kalinowskii]